MILHKSPKGARMIENGRCFWQDIRQHLTNVEKRGQANICHPDPSFIRESPFEFTFLQSDKIHRNQTMHWNRRSNDVGESTGPANQQQQQHLDDVQTHLVAATGEFVGTFLFLFMGYAGHMMIVDQSAASTSMPGFLQTVAIAYAYGFSLLVTAWAFYRISGGLFNPAVWHLLSRVQIDFH
jgi:hypothetical protein